MGWRGWAALAAVAVVAPPLALAWVCYLQAKGTE